MKKIFSLIRVSLSHDMNIFKINTKKQNKFLKILIPLIVTLYIMFILGFYSYVLIDKLRPLHLEYVSLTLFGLVVSILTFIEGIYKSSSLLFNCKDDNLLFSLPIKKRTVLFIRIFKFYIFELIYNSLFLLPTIIVYAIFKTPSFSYYIVSFLALIILPILPIILSCIIGFLITYFSSKFKGKNIFQTIFTVLFILIVMYVSYNMEGFINDIATKAVSLNDFIIKLYYPVGAYVKLVNNFNFKDLLIFILSHIAIFSLIIMLLGKLYFKINSSFKKVINTHKSKKYKIKKNSPTKAIIKKELNKFVSTPVYITNTGFGLVLFIIGSIMISIKFDSIVTLFMQMNASLTVDVIKSKLPMMMLGLIAFGSFMTSITSSMISLEGKSFSILKSLPISPYKVVRAKVLTAVLVMIPCILIGDIIIFIRFNFNVISIILTLIATILFPLVTELIGIIINLKYPKLDAVNDTEVVKQSMSSLISTFIGLGLTGGTIFFLIKMLDTNISNYIIMLFVLTFYLIIYIVLDIYLHKTCEKSFNNINV